MYIKADIGREENIISFLRDKLQSDKLRIERLTIGDYLICDDNHIYACIERKTLNDFSASIMDGRYENREKMVELREATNCQLFYIVEGTGLFKHSKNHGNFPSPPLSKIDHAMNSLMVRDKIFIVRTKDLNHTSDQLIELLSSFERFAVIKTGSNDEIHLAQVQPKLTIMQEMINAWDNITGISRPIAIFLSKSINISDLLHGKIDTRKLIYCGKPLRRPILQVLNNIEEHRESFLKGINGMGEKKYMPLRNITFMELSEKTAEEIATLQFTENDKKISIGQKLAEKIFSIINYRATEPNSSNNDIQDSKAETITDSSNGEMINLSSLVCGMKDN